MITGINFSFSSILYFKLHKIDFFCTQFLKCSFHHFSYFLRKKKYSPTKNLLLFLNYVFAIHMLDISFYMDSCR